MGIVNCAKCGSRVIKVPGEGCNHMTCTKCKYQWCWLCGAEFKEDHFDPWNLFGCRDLQFDLDISRCRQVCSCLLTLLLIPFILLFHPIVIVFKAFYNPLYMPREARWMCPFKEWLETCFEDNCCGKIWIFYVVF